MKAESPSRSQAEASGLLTVDSEDSGGHGHGASYTSD